MNQAMKDVPELVPVGELDSNYSRRQLAHMAQVNRIGTPEWRNRDADKPALVKALTDAFKSQGVVPTKRGTPSQKTVTPSCNAVQGAIPSGLILPAVDPTFVIDDTKRVVLDYIATQGVQTGYAPNVQKIGPKGCGKTELAMQFAARRNLPVLKMNCPTVRETRDWFGHRGVTAGSTFWHTTLFVKAVRGEFGPVMILLDEITRATPMVLNSLLPLLDATRETYIEELGEVLRVAPNVYWFATANIGAEYTGTHGQLDSALNDRFGIKIECTFLPEEDEIGVIRKRTGISEEPARRLVRFANEIRRMASGVGGQLTETISTRTLCEAARLFMHEVKGTPMGKEAFKVTIYPLFSADEGVSSERSLVIQKADTLFR